MTANEKRCQQRIKALQDTLFVIGGKWNIPVITAICYGNKRFTDIAVAVPKITNRVLSKELKHLEENLLISRRIVDEYPVLIEYTLTPYCASLFDVIVSMEKWGNNHKKKIIGK